MARTKQKARKTKRIEAQNAGRDIIDLTSPTDGKETLNRKQKMRKLFRQQQKVIRQLEKKYQNTPSSSEVVLIDEDASVNAATSSSLPLNERGAEERKALIDTATKEAIMTRLLSLFPSNKDKVCNTAPFIGKSDQYRQISRLKRQLGKMPYQSLKADVLWLCSDGAVSRSPSVEGMTLAEELLKFADYVSLSEGERSSRERLLKELSDVVSSKFPLAAVNAFGSYSADLSIFLSDLDVSIHFPQPQSSPRTSLPATSVVTEGSSGTSSEARNKHIYLEVWEADKDRDTDTDKDKGEAEDGDSDVISWTVDGLQGGKSALTSSPRALEKEGGGGVTHIHGSDVFCFDENDFIRERQVSLSTSSDVSDTSSDGEKEGEEERAGRLTIDDFDDEEEEEVEEGSGGSDEEEAEMEVEEDLDIQVIGLSPEEVRRSGGEPRSLHSSEMEFSNAFQFDSDDGEYVSAAMSSEKQKAAKERDVIVNKLRSLMPVLKAMDWTSKIEFRSRAKVPIINLFHLNGVECDVSIGQAAKDTSELVAAVKKKTGPALFVLSAFLKVFLSQLDLDKPFTGGLGSFKLYLMIAAHVRDFFPHYRNATDTDKTPQTLTSSHLVYGEMLLSFLHFYGNPLNLNEHSDVSFEGVAVSFSSTRLAREIQTSFRTAHDILISASKQRLALLKKRWRQSQRQHDISEDDDVSNEYSLSLLGSVIDAATLRQQRGQHSRQCDSFPMTSPLATDALVSQQLLPHLLDRLDLEVSALTLDHIAALSPSLALRLRSFHSLDRLTHALGLEQHRLQRQRKTQQATSDRASASAAMTSTYSFNHYGIVGQSVAQAMASREAGGMSQSKRKAKRKKRRSDSHDHNYRDEEGGGGGSDSWEEEREEGEERRRKMSRYESRREDSRSAESLAPRSDVTLTTNDMAEKINHLRHAISVYKEKLHTLDS